MLKTLFQPLQPIVKLVVLTHLYQQESLGISAPLWIEHFLWVQVYRAKCPIKPCKHKSVLVVLFNCWVHILSSKANGWMKDPVYHHPTTSTVEGERRMIWWMSPHALVESLPVIFPAGENSPSPSECSTGMEKGVLAWQTATSNWRSTRTCASMAVVATMDWMWEQMGILWFQLSFHSCHLALKVLDFKKMLTTVSILD